MGADVKVALTTGSSRGIGRHPVLQCAPHGLGVVVNYRGNAEREAKGIYREPVRSSHGHFVKASGLRWLSLMRPAPIPWTGRVCLSRKRLSAERPDWRVVPNPLRGRLASVPLLHLRCETWEEAIGKGARETAPRRDGKANVPPRCPARSSFWEGAVQHTEVACGRGSDALEAQLDHEGTSTALFSATE